MIPTSNNAPTTRHGSSSQLIDERKPISENSRSNVPVSERAPVQKFTRSSSMNQISLSFNHQEEILPVRNKSISSPDSRFALLSQMFPFSLLTRYFLPSFAKGVYINAFRLVSVLGRGHFGKVISISLYLFGIVVFVCPSKGYISRMSSATWRLLRIESIEEKRHFST